MTERFFRWFWRGGQRSAGEQAHRVIKSGAPMLWTAFCNYMERAYTAGYNAGKRSAEAGR